MGTKILTVSLTFILCVCVSSYNTNHPDCTYNGDVAHCENRKLISVPSTLKHDIRVLDLSNNIIHILKNYTFVNYSKLEVLNLANNKIDTIGIKAFTGLQSLKELNLENNKLNILTLSEELVHPINNLLSLYISGNVENKRREKFIYPDKALSMMPGLKNLSLDMQPRPYFGREFQKLSNLYLLRFDHCYLGRHGKGDVLINETFQYFSKSVRTFFLNGCSFFKMHSGILRQFPFLDILDLSNTYIHLYQAMDVLSPFKNKSMSVINFHKVSDYNLDTVEFPYSVIVTSKMTTYLNSICVGSLDLSKSGIVGFEVRSLFDFQHPECIKTLILSVNRIPLTDNVHIFEVVRFFGRARNIKVYDFSYLTVEYPNPTFLDVYNPFKMSGATDYVNVQSKNSGIINNITIYLPQSIEFIRIRHVMASDDLSSIKCTNTSLKYLDISFGYYKAYPTVSFECGKNLEYLDVSGISSILFPSHIEKIPQLKTLIMTNAELSRSLLAKSTTLFWYTPQLTFLDISFNNLWFLDDDIFSNIPEIKHINMSNNLLRDVPNALVTLRNLHTLDVSNNLITSIDIDVLKWMDSLVSANINFTLFLSNNALVCSCDTLHFLEWFATTKVNIKNRLSHNCSLNGKSTNLRKVAKHLHFHFSDCNSESWLHIGIVIIASFFGILIPFSILYNFRYRIILSVYKKFRKVVEKTLDLNYQYDLYVSYEDSSVPWIKNSLIPKVEDEWGLKMCLQDRDILPGEYTADAMAESIEQSRHIMFIVTKDFIEKRWGRFEIDRAKYERYTQNLRKIIVIKKDVNMSEIPEQLLNIWKDVCFIEWPDTWDNNNDKNNDELENQWMKLKMYLFLS